MSNIQPNRKQKSISSLPSHNSDTFDFDLWARQVKRQMLACLRKRGAL